METGRITECQVSFNPAEQHTLTTLPGMVRKFVIKLKILVRFGFRRGGRATVLRFFSGLCGKAIEIDFEEIIEIFRLRLRSFKKIVRLVIVSKDCRFVAFGRRQCTALASSLRRQFVSFNFCVKALKELQRIYRGLGTTGGGRNSIEKAWTIWARSLDVNKEGTKTFILR